MHYIAIQ